MRRGDVTIASEKRYMFLFNDLCLVAKPDSKGINYQFKYSLFTHLILSLSLSSFLFHALYSHSVADTWLNYHEHHSRSPPERNIPYCSLSPPSLLGFPQFLFT